MRDLKIYPLKSADAPDLCSLLTRDPQVYHQYFTPFSATVESITGILDQTKRDQYWGIKAGVELAGFFMLRGLDAGYQSPSFGVYIAQRFSQCGLAKLALQYALSWCQLNHLEQIMLSVHPDNVHARGTYEKAGFAFGGEFTQQGHRIYRKSLPQRAQSRI